MSSVKQVKKIFTVANQLNMRKSTVENLVGGKSVKDLSNSEAGRVICKLEKNVEYKKNRVVYKNGGVVPMSGYQKFTIESKFTAIRKIKNYGIDTLCHRVTKKDDYFTLNSKEASKFIFALERILLNLQNPQDVEDKPHVDQRVNNDYEKKREEADFGQ